MVVVYDLSPGAAFGLAQRSVYTPDGKAGLGAKYVNCPTLTLDRVNGAKVLTDAKAGKTATLTLKARFERDTGKAIIALSAGQGLRHAAGRAGPARHPHRRDVADRGERRPRHDRHHVLLQPPAAGGAAAHARLLLRLPALHAGRRGQLAAIRLLHAASRAPRSRSWRRSAWSTWAAGRPSRPGRAATSTSISSERPENGGVITSLMDVYNNNIWLVEAIARAATDNHWPRVDVKAGDVGPGVNGGFQGRVKSPMNKGRGLPASPASGSPATGRAAGPRPTRSSTPRPAPTASTRIISCSRWPACRSWPAS